MPIADRIAKYFVVDADVSMPGEDVPLTAEDCRATHLIDGANYFGAIKAEMDALKASGAANRFFYFTDWLLTLVAYNGDATAHGLPSAWPQNVQSGPFQFDDGTGTKTAMLDALADLAAAGVDVRAFPWVSPFVLKFKKVADKEKRYRNYAATVMSVDALRKKPGFEHSVVLNLLAHPLGAIHLKMVVCGDDNSARGFASGLDFEPGRFDSQDHPNGGPGGYGWHDIGVKLEGPGVDRMYSYFQRLWNEQLSRPVERFRVDDIKVASHDDQCTEVPDRTSAPVPGGTNHVQVLRTAPQFNLGLSETAAVPVGCIVRIATSFQRPKLSFAPDGIFEFRAALRKAILAAQNYIYAEDQAFTGREIMEWVNQALQNSPALKVIFHYGGDPTDPPELQEMLNMAVNEHLAPGVANIEDRVAFHFRTDNVVVHTKSWIIDDEWAVIGSANSMRRSLYTDGELSVAVLDENEGPGSFAVDYRCDLWAEHCGVLDAAGRAAFADLDGALQIWHPSWTSMAPSPGTLRPALARRKVPFVQGPGADEFAGIVLLPATAQDRKDIDDTYDQSDGDSRSTF
jgi:phosphatidylserine/phosphatidylglycerophosphate/cardiolipin synthase-like enzyme